MAEDESTPKKSGAKNSAPRAIEKLVEARFLIDEADADLADAIGYVHAVLSQIGLPRAPQKERVWTRVNGSASLTLIAGGVMERGHRIEQPLPQGPYARLIMADICSYAVRYKTPFVPMEDSVSAYMRNRLRLFPGGGKRGTYTSFKREAQALATAHMELAYEAGGKCTQTKAAPIESFDAWLVDEGEQRSLWPCELELSKKFFDSLRGHALPIDMRAYRALSHSALAQDIYTWLTHRLPRLKTPLGLPWAVLAQQFGGYSDVPRFRKEFLKRLREVHAVYPDAQVEVRNGRRGELGGSLQLKPSRPSIDRVSVVVPGFIGGSAELGERQLPSDASVVESEKLSTLEMHGPVRDEAPRDPLHHLRVRVEQLTGLLRIASKEHKQRPRWEKELLEAKAELAQHVLR